MSTTTAIVLDRKGRAKEGKEAMLDIRITSNRRHVYLSTGIKVRKSEWIAGQVVNRLDAKSLNERLAIIYKKAAAFGFTDCKSQIIVTKKHTGHCVNKLFSVFDEFTVFINFKEIAGRSCSRFNS